MAQLVGLICIQIKIIMYKKTNKGYFVLLEVINVIYLEMFIKII